jgi:flagellar protein FliO/FliZ
VSPPSSDLDTYLRFASALGFVIALMLACGWALRKVTASGRLLGLGGSRSGRLAVVESVMLDPRRRLVLVRRDRVEHLLLLGVTGDLVIERGIAADIAAGTAPVPIPPPGESPS